MHTFLIGFMCSGKSTVGKVLAARLGVPFVDLDRKVEERVGPLVPFFQREGEEAFRSLEREALDALGAQGPLVVACGGGTPCQGDNLQVMQTTGRVVWLDVPLQALMPRIEKAGGDRPLLLGLKGEALKARVETLQLEREPCYAMADAIVQADADPDVVADRIALAIKALQDR